MAAMAQEPEEIKDMEAFLKMAKYPLVKHTDMTQEMREEAMDTCITAVEKHHADMEKCTQVSFTRAADLLQRLLNVFSPQSPAEALLCSQMIKETMDKKFGAPWHVVAGGYFSYDITFEVHNDFVLRFSSLLQ